MEHCINGTIPSASELFADLSVGGIVLMTVLSLLTLLCVGIFIEELSFILQHLDCWRKRSRTMWLLGMYPAFSVTSLLGIMVPRSSTLCDLVSAIYLSVCLFEFLRLIINYYGGEEKMCLALSQIEVSLSQPPLACCCVCCLPKTRLTLRNLWRIKIAVLQVAIMRPLLMFIAAVLWSDGGYRAGDINPGRAYFWITIVNSISALTAMYGLVVVFRVSKEPLKVFKITSKFIALQLVIIFSNLQGFVFNILASTGIIPCEPPLSSKSQGAAMNHATIICEMFLLSLWARWLYRRKLQEKTYRNLEEEEATFESVPEQELTNHIPAVIYGTSGSTES